MFLIIVGTGAMGNILRECAERVGALDRIEMVEPTDKNWPEEKADLIIDFSHPNAIKDKYEYYLNLIFQNAYYKLSRNADGAGRGSQRSSAFRSRKAAP